jgi:polyisoprenoid-binding protein YceI
VHIDARSSVHGIHSRTSGIEGFVRLALRDDGVVDTRAPADGRLSLAVEHLRSGNLFEERELRKRIDAKRFPTIDGVLATIAPTDRDDTYFVTGDLSFRGVTLEQKGLMTIGSDGDGALRMRGEAMFDIRDFGMEPPRILALKVDPVVTVRVELTAARVS